MATAKQLTADILKLSEAIELAKNKLSVFEAQLRGGGLDPAKYDKITASIEKLNKIINESSARRDALISQKDTTSIDSTVKAIDTLQKKLETLRGEQNRQTDLVGGTSTVESLKKIQSEIKTTEAALKSFQSRAVGNFTPEGRPLTEGYNASKYGAINATDEQPGFGGASVASRLANITRVVSAEGTIPPPPIETKLQIKELDDTIVALRQHLFAVIAAQEDVGTKGEWNKLQKQVEGYKTAIQAAYEAQNTLRDSLKQTANEAGVTNFGLGKPTVTEPQMPANVAAQVSPVQARYDAQQERAMEELLGNKNRGALLEKEALGQDNAALRDMLSTTERYKTVWAEIVRLHMEDAQLSVKQYTQGGVAEITAKKNVGGIEQVQKFGVGEGGDVTPTVPRAYQTFLQGITRDFRELMKWSVAIALIYGPLNALSTAMQQLVTNEAKLADVAIAVNDSVANQTQIFATVAQSAQQMGEDVGGVIDAFGQAYRATGGAAEGTARYALAVKLMNDATVLSKVSVLSHAEAIDSLSAALYQTGRGLDQGASLLDEWVTVSRNANVTIGDLAQGVATIGGSAEVAGLSVEQLNALLATLSQTTLLTGASLATAAKALIGQYQTPEAIKALQTYGVAVKDTAGNVRQFLDVYNEVANLKKTGIIGQPDLNTLTLALGGGGIRNQKNVQQFIEGLASGTVDRLTALQTGEGVSGAAQEALAKKLDTVQTSVTKLANSFQMLGMALGQEGGLLNDFQQLIDFGTQLVTVLSNVTAALGKAGPLLYAIGIASLLNGSRGGVLGGALGALGVGTGGGAGIAGALGGFFSKTGQNQGGYMNGNVYTPYPTRPGLGYSALTNPYVLGGIGVAIPAIQNFASGRNVEGGANIAGGILGALATGGTPIGAIIGSSIAEAFVTKTMTYDTQFANFFAGAFKAGAAAKPEAVTTEQELTKKAFESIGGGAGMDWLGKLIAKNFEVFGGKVPGFATAEKAYNTPEAAALELLRTRNPELYTTISQRGQAAGGPTLEERTKSLLTPETTNTLAQLQQKQLALMQQQSAAGTLKPSDYASQLSAIPGSLAIATKYMATFGEEYKKLDPLIKTTNDEYSKFVDIVVYGSDEQKNTLNALATQINDLQNLVDNWNPESKNIEIDVNGQKVKFENLNLAKTALGASQQAAAQYANTTTSGILATQQPVLPVANLGGTQGQAVSLATLEAALKSAYAEQQTREKASGMSIEQAAAYESQLGKFLVKVVDQSGNEFYKVVNDGGQKVEQALVEGAAAIKQGIPLNAMTNVTPAQYAQAEAQYPAMAAQFVAAGGTLNETPQIVELSDKQFFQQTKDWRLMQILLGQIAATEQKQLDGMYNIPEGATFWVPLTAAYYRPQGTGGGGLDVPTVQENTTQTELNTQALLDLTAKLGGDLPLLRGSQTPATVNPVQGTEPNPVKGYQPWMSNRDFLPPNEALTLSPEPRGFQTPQTSNYTVTQNEPGTLLDQISKAVQDLNNFLAGGAPSKTPTPDQSGAELNREIQSMIDFFTGLFGGNQQPKGTGLLVPTGNQNPAATTVPQLSTKLNINFNSTTQLSVDGRVLAEIIKPYLVADLLQSQQSQSSTTRSFVI